MKKVKVSFKNITILGISLFLISLLLFALPAISFVDGDLVLQKNNIFSEIFTNGQEYQILQNIDLDGGKSFKIKINLNEDSIEQKAKELYETIKNRIKISNINFINFYLYKSTNSKEISLVFEFPNYIENPESYIKLLLTPGEVKFNVISNPSENQKEAFNSSFSPPIRVSDILSVRTDYLQEIGQDGKPLGSHLVLEFKEIAFTAIKFYLIPKNNLNAILNIDNYQFILLPFEIFAQDVKDLTPRVRAFLISNDTEIPRVAQLSIIKSIFSSKDELLINDLPIDTNNINEISITPMYSIQSGIYALLVLSLLTLSYFAYVFIKYKFKILYLQLTSLVIMTITPIAILRIFTTPISLGYIIGFLFMSIVILLTQSLSLKYIKQNESNELNNNDIPIAIFKSMFFGLFVTGATIYNSVRNFQILDFGIYLLISGIIGFIFYSFIFLRLTKLLGLSK